MNIFDDQRANGSGVFSPQLYSLPASVRVFADQRAGSNAVFGEQVLALNDVDERRQA